NKAKLSAKEGYIVTFGIIPTRVETGYGYIEVGESIGIDGCYKAVAFKEKPDVAVANQYISSGKCLWNSGMFVFTGETFRKELEKHSPNIAGLFYLDTDEEIKSYFENDIEDISIDYALMEKTDSVAVVKSSFEWSDVGSWESIYDVMEKNGADNVKIGNVIAIDSKRNLIIGGKRLIATIGLEDMIVVETPDAVLIAKKGECQKVKDIVSQLKENGDATVESHLTEYRPWGSFTLFETGERYKIKKITVNPGEALSLQMHHHRSEHWIVVRGTAKVINGDKEIYLHENESVYIPKSTVHRLENPGKVTLELIEVQVGEYVEEDDIVRFEDKYERCNIGG
ncbi:MAG: mannose-1-phosphate guanylyltransferase/mannose-6-phosphate isomerase, partial [Thermodesulfovibrio sp.]|nr:mannose-1-phosphate guanylyltransferase/mannose-6-phosphate isomerase [Thermodesulfovibrio sp.]